VREGETSVFRGPRRSRLQRLLMTFSLLAIAALVNGLLIGLVPTLVDGLKKSLQTRLNLPEHRSDWFVWLFYLAWLPAMPLAGWMLDSWANHDRDVLFYSLVALMLALAWLAHVQSQLSACSNALFLGTAYSGVTTATVHLMTSVFFLSDPYPYVAALNLGFVAVGFGALLGPVVVAAIERRWGYRQGLLALSVACIVPAALAILSERPIVAPPSDAPSWAAVCSHPLIGMIVGIILLYFALENCFESWPEPYLRELGYQERGQRLGMTLFWLSFIAARGLAAWWLWLHPSQAFGWMFILALLSGLIVANLAGGYEVGSGSFGFILAGAVHGPLLPGFLGMAFVLYPALPASALGLLLALSGLDTLVVRPLMRVFAKDRPPRKVMRVPAILAILLAAPLLLLAFMRN
jgi:MFS family permease